MREQSHKNRARGEGRDGNRPHFYRFFAALDFVTLAALFVFRFTRSGSFFAPVSRFHCSKA
jgi:hypothetical protein